MSRRCFPWMNRAWATLPPAERMQAFYSLPKDEQRECWESLGRRIACDHWNAYNAYREAAGAEPLSARPNCPKRGRHLKALQVPQTRSQSRSGGFEKEDVLQSIPGTLYFPALAGIDVPPDGGMVSCPFHEDRHPSCRVYAEPGRGHYCFSCGRGGSAIDLAAGLLDLEPRGDGYLQLRRWVAERLLGPERSWAA